MTQQITDIFSYFLSSEYLEMLEKHNALLEKENLKLYKEMILYKMYITYLKNKYAYKKVLD